MSKGGLSISLYFLLSHSLELGITFGIDIFFSSFKIIHKDFVNLLLKLEIGWLS